MNYYKIKQIIAKVDKKDNIIGKVDKLNAHKKGVFHRGYTICLTFQNQIILQHRKHPAFDGYFDFTCSSHQIYEKNTLQDNNTSIYKALKREWNISKKDLLNKPRLVGYVIYKAKDGKSKLIENELCYFFTAKIKRIPYPNMDYAYGFSLIKKSSLNKNNKIYALLAPWAKKIIEKEIVEEI